MSLSKTEFGAIMNWLSCMIVMNAYLAPVAAASAAYASTSNAATHSSQLVFLPSEFRPKLFCRPCRKCVKTLPAATLGSSGTGEEGS